MSNTDLQEPEEFIEDAVSELENIDSDYVSRALPRWYNQEHYVEIWLEKAAQESTFVHALKGREVRIVPNKGYSSLTFIWENCQRLLRVKDEEPDKQIHIRYFGDKDPSGEDMDRDIIERIEMITGWTEGEEFDFERIAVTVEQIKRYNLPEMPEDQETKDKYERDPTLKTFRENNDGIDYAVELDALAVYAPDDYIKLIQDTTDDFYVEEIYNAELEKRSSSEFRQEIRQTVYDKTKEFLDGYDTSDIDTGPSDEDEDDDSDTSGDNTPKEEDE